MVINSVVNEYEWAKQKRVKEKNMYIKCNFTVK